MDGIHVSVLQMIEAMNNKNLCYLFVYRTSGKPLNKNSGSAIPSGSHLD